MEVTKQITDYIKNNELDLDRIIDDFTPYVKTIINNSASNILSFEDREEIFSDTFFILWKSEYENIISLPAYISGIVKNLIREKLKKKNITYDISEYENIVYFTDYSINLFSEERDIINEINKILSTFKSLDVQIINMFYYSSNSTKDIAKKLNISEVNVRARLSRIRKKIRKKLEKGGNYGR